MSDADFTRLREALDGQYEFQRELGRGGMAVVFLARDHKHRRSVAIKVLHGELGATLGAERFQREIEISAGLSHPHILTLIDSGQVAGSLYYVMPYVEGQSLRDRLRKDQQLSIEDAVRIAREVASALDYAHAQGVIHRDIKPENILLSHGNALLADFGIARAVSQAAGEALTSGRIALGTPLYMSPEHATDSVFIDGRADLYSLGCVLYEMLTGQPPYGGPTALSLIAQHVAAPIPSARLLRRTVTPLLDAVIQCALAKSPVDRFGSGAAMADAIVSAVTGSSQPVPVEHDHASIAVLPFRNLSADADNEYFSDGVTEEILNALMSIPSLRVASRSSSFAFKGQDLGAVAIGQRLNVKTILEGSLRKAGARIRITTQLINTDDGYTLWSGQYDRELQDVFAIQEDIARTIVETLRVTLTKSQTGNLATRQTDNLEAYELYLRGRHFWHRRGTLKKSMEHFQKALESDPDYALAFHGLADGFCVLGLYGYQPPGPVISHASRALARAIQLAPGLAEVRTSQGFLQLLAWDWPGAERSFRLATELNPNYPLAHSFSAWLHAIRGRASVADVAARRGAELEPLSPVTCGIEALVAYHRRDYGRAIQAAERAMEIEPSSFLPLLAVTLSHAARGNYSAALEFAEAGVALSPDAMFLRGSLGAVYGMAGERGKAQQVLDDFDRRSATTYVAPILRSWIHSHIGQPDLAFQSLEAAYAERSCPLGLGVRFPIYDGIRADPRFAHLLERMELGAETVDA